MSYPPQPPQYQQPPYQQQGYNPYAMVPVQPKSSPLALTGFIMALAAIVLSFVNGGFGMIVNLAAFVVSLVAKNQIKNSGGALTGRGMAVAGIAISSTWFGLGVLTFLLTVIATLLGWGLVLSIFKGLGTM